ncbi:hypothetical protein CLV92_10943 [Kineococcus xinjiangensis]|uniref:Uncharacterized protein n=1 Tax=Kineococcus xinjiangensis TaxID=512762 RepID=A0A2S6IHS8_9ACTN|nr:hypothetical protein [Kineococcus xinjiangensis]PPK93767.1 hypothetical protein CLV92_10943 [Kineococcus xinjiangensis]
MIGNEAHLEEQSPVARHVIDEAAAALEERLRDWRCVLPLRAGTAHAAARRQLEQYRRAVRDGHEDAVQALGLPLVSAATLYSS